MEDKITISTSRIRTFFYFLGSIAFGVMGLILMRTESPLNFLFGFLCLAFSLFAVIFFFIRLLFRPPSIGFDKNGVMINLSNKNNYNIPWAEVKEIGIQTAGVMVGVNAMGTDYLVISFKDKSKYNFNFGKLDKSLFPIPNKDNLNSYMGDFKGDLYVLLWPNVSPKKIESLPKEFQEKLSINIKNFPYLLKTKDQNLYQMAVKAYNEKSVNDKNPTVDKLQHLKKQGNVDQSKIKALLKGFFLVVIIMIVVNLSGFVLGKDTLTLITRIIQILWLPFVILLYFLGVRGNDKHFWFYFLGFIIGLVVSGIIMVSLHDTLLAVLPKNNSTATVTIQPTPTTSVDTPSGAEEFCNNSQYLRKLVGSTKDLSILDYKYDNNQKISWNRTEKEPKITYTGKHLLDFSIKDSTPEQAKQLIDNAIVNNLTKLGFSIDLVNTYSFDQDPPGTAYRLAYRNNSNVIIIEYEQAFNFNIPGPTSDIRAFVDCGQITDQKLDSLYDEIIPLVKIAYPTLEKADTLSITTNKEDLYYVVHVSTRKGTGGGYPIGILRKNGKLQVIWRGGNQDSTGGWFNEPLCSDLESNGAPSGIECVELTPEFNYRKSI